MTPELSVVVPIHNEAGNLPALLREIRAVLDQRVDYEVVCVDDGSDDTTHQQLAALAAELGRIRILRHAKRAGQSAATVSGVRAARGKWIATLDGDGQNDPGDIPRLLAAIQDPTAPVELRLVIGNRRKRQDSWTKRKAGRLANAIRARVLGDATPDSGCGLKLFCRDSFLAIPHFDHMHRFLPALFLRNGWQVASVPVNHRPRLHGRSHYGILDRALVGLSDLAGVLWLKRRMLDSTSTEGSHDS